MVEEEDESNEPTDTGADDGAVNDDNETIDNGSGDGETENGTDVTTNTESNDEGTGTVVDEEPEEEKKVIVYPDIDTLIDTSEPAN